MLLGAAGFIGSAVLTELARLPVRIRCVGRRPLAAPPGVRAEIEVLERDLVEPGAMASAVDGADVIVHAVLYSAATSTWRIEEGDTSAERVNVGLMGDLVDVLSGSAAERPPKVVYIGTVMQAGPHDKGLLDGTEVDRPVTEYDRQKLAAERVLLDGHGSGVLRGVSLRLPTVFGPGRGTGAFDRGVVSAMARRALDGNPLTMWHDGTVERDLVYVDDVARAVVAAVDHVEHLGGRNWLIGTGVGEPLGPVFEQVATLAAERTGKPRVPVVSVEPPAGSEPTDFHNVVVDANAFRGVTGWRPQVSLGEGLRRTVEFLAETGKRVAP
ncbi:NAD-dependent epimerase/dehydratase family protein [Streptomyces sp. NPDC005955]|uniref:NAD-dependent epimerase/dehydratase family protein n=1 Tax=Streptomyces sp. NPDC005955 TaxID=3364738 RepID=UPI0036C92B0D